MNEITPQQQYHINKLNNQQSNIPFGQPSATSPPKQFQMNNRQYLQGDHQEKRQYFQTPQPSRKQFVSAKPFSIVGGSPEVVKKSFEMEKDYINQNLQQKNQKIGVDNHNFFSKLSANVLNSNLNAFTKLSMAQQEEELLKMKEKNFQNSNNILPKNKQFGQQSNILKPTEISSNNKPTDQSITPSINSAIHPFINHSLNPSISPYMRWQFYQLINNRQQRHIKKQLNQKFIKRSEIPTQYATYKAIIQSGKTPLQTFGMGNKSFKGQIHAFYRDSLIRIEIYEIIFKKAKYLSFENENGQPFIDPSKKTLVIDMDETLIHSVPTKRYGKHSVIVNSSFQRYELFFNLRPYAIQFLERLSQFYELIIFSASTEPYVTAIINYLDPSHTLISHHLSRNNCYVSPQGYFVKDLRVIPRNQNNILIIDNLAISYAFNLPNAIPVLEWQGDTMDDQLNYIAEFLEKIAVEDDVCKACESYFKLEELEKMTKIDLGIH